MADLFRKGKSLYSSTTNSFGTGTGETITPSSVAGLPTDTELVLTFDRTVTGKLERIRGHISGGNFVIDERGVDNTSDTSHTSPTVEYIPNAEDMNDLVDGILVNHTQAGLHDFNGTEVILDADADTTITADTDDQIDIKIAGTDRFTLTATALKLGGDQEITDSSGNELLSFTKTASAVNELTVANAATGNGPTISATGGDDNVDINITPKGTGKVSQGKTQFTTQAYFDAEIDDGNSGTSDTIDWTTGNKHKSTVTGDVTYTFTAPSGPCNLILKLVNGGAHTPVWPDTVLWSGGEEPSWTASGTDIVAMYWDGTNYYSQASLDFS